MHSFPFFRERTSESTLFKFGVHINHQLDIYISNDYLTYTLFTTFTFTFMFKLFAIYLVGKTFHKVFKLFCFKFVGYDVWYLTTADEEKCPYFIRNFQSQSFPDSNVSRNDFSGRRIKDAEISGYKLRYQWLYN